MSEPKVEPVPTQAAEAALRAGETVLNQATLPTFASFAKVNLHLEVVELRAQGAPAVDDEVDVAPPVVDLPAARTLCQLAEEVEILDNIAQGMTNKQVAYALSISEQTVKNHLSHIFDKVGVSNRLELALYAMHHRLLEQLDANGKNRRP